MAITYNSLSGCTLTPHFLGLVIRLFPRSSSPLFGVLSADVLCADRRRRGNSRRTVRDGQRSDTEIIWGQRIGGTLSLPLSYAVLHRGRLGARRGYILFERRDLIRAGGSFGSARRVRGRIGAHWQKNGCWDCQVWRWMLRDCLVRALESVGQNAQLMLHVDAIVDGQVLIGWA